MLHTGLQKAARRRALQRRGLCGMPAQGRGAYADECVGGMTNAGIARQCWVAEKSEH